MTQAQIDELDKSRDQWMRLRSELPSKHPEVLKAIEEFRELGKNCDHKLPDGSSFLYDCLEFDGAWCDLCDRHVSYPN